MKQGAESDLSGSVMAPQASHKSNPSSIP